MSLTSLEKRAVAKPLEAELDRQKEKNAAVKKRLKGLQDYVEAFVQDCERRNQAGGRPALTPELKALRGAVRESKQV